MPFSVGAHAVFDGFKSAIKNGPVVLQPQGIVAAQPVVYNTPPYWITTDGADRPINPIITKLILMNDRTVMEQLTRQELINFFQFVEQNSDANYRSVKTNALWKTLYGVRPKQFDTYNSKTNAKGTEMHDATYCQRCHVILPLRNLTIDHQKPQQGGDMEAMLRVFRAAGLTVATGSGPKNRYLQGQIAATVGGSTTVLARGQRGSDHDRYSLSIKGIIYYTALVHYSLTGEMRQMSMHHIANLRPMCGPCNSSLRNSNVTFWL